jgi:hypothetical protein
MSIKPVVKTNFVVLDTPMAASIKKVFMPQNDPRTAYKLKVFEALGMECHDLPQNAADCRDGLLEVSSLSVLPENFQAMVKEAKAVLIAPELDGTIAGLDIENSNKLIPALPMRYWGMVESVTDFLKANSGGELVSFRIFMNLPVSRMGLFGDFSKSFLPQIIDVACLVAGSKPENIQLQLTSGFNCAFGMVKFPGNIIAELDVNECLSDALEPLRFIHAYCKEGAISNLPFGGYTNVEGALLATAEGLSRPVYEHNIWNGGDELDNFYFRMIYKIRNGGILSAPDVKYSDLVKTTAAAVRSGVAVMGGGAA